MVFKTNVKNGKIKIFESAENSYSNEFKKFYTVFLFVTFCCRDMQQNWIQNMDIPMNGTVFAVFALLAKTNT